MRFIPALVSIIAGLITIRRGRAGSLPRNYFAGIRLPSTLRTDVAWAAAHRASWMSIALTGLILAAWGVWVMADEDAVYAGPVVIVLGILPILMIASFVARGAAVKAHRRDTGS